MSDLIIGYGEVGQALHELIPEAHVFDVNDTDLLVGLADSYNVLHIAFPWTLALSGTKHWPPSGGFEEEVAGYVERYNPDLTIVYSTVPIGTCEGLGVVHSPVEGKHPHLAASMELMPRWIGTSSSHLAVSATAFWSQLVRRVQVVDSAGITEYLKLRSTARYGINLAFANYEANVAERAGVPYELVAEFDEQYNDLYRGLGFDDVGRYVLDDPHGVIGGHCVVPNAKILNEQYPSAMLEEIIDLE